MTREELKQRIYGITSKMVMDSEFRLSDVEKIMLLIDEYTQPKTKSLEERKRAFQEKISKFKQEYPSELLREFYYYWTEHGDNDKKMRFEKEKSFGIKRRLVTWKKKDEEWKQKHGDKPDKMEQIINW